MSDLDTRSHYMSGYEKLLDECERSAFRHPEAYHVLQEITGRYKDWLSAVSDIKPLRDFPSLEVIRK